MQGRLVPRIGGRIQAFPWSSWLEEFPAAARIGFDSIEFIFEGPNHERHPLMTEAGRTAIRGSIEQSGVRVSSICADYFMQEPLFRGTPEERKPRADVLHELMRGTAAIGARKVEIPCVDISSLKTREEHDLLIAAVDEAMPLAEELDLEILLETDLEPADFARLLDRIPSERFGANYDTGNSASLGFDADDEIAAYGKRILNIHIKDRVLGGTTVPLGTGNANFEQVFTALEAIGYEHPFILQTARDPDNVGVATKYFNQVRGWVTQHLARRGTAA